MKNLKKTKNFYNLIANLKQYREKYDDHDHVNDKRISISIEFLQNASNDIMKKNRVDVKQNYKTNANAKKMI